MWMPRATERIESGSEEAEGGRVMPVGIDGGREGFVKVELVVMREDVGAGAACALASKLDVCNRVLIMSKLSKTT